MRQSLVARSKKHVNPFYVLLIVLGTVFALTACAYGVVAFRALQPPERVEDSPMLAFFDERGEALLGVELVLLGIATFAAIGADDYWARRARTTRVSGEDSDV